MTRLPRTLPRIPKVPPAWAALLLALAALALLLSGCDRSGSEQQGSAAAPAQRTEAGAPPAGAKSFGADAQATAGAEDNAPVILCLGDSLTAGHGLPEDDSFPSLLQQRLKERGYAYRVVNAGVSGDTSAGGLARLDWVLRQRVDIMILELGANDGLRGLSTEAMRKNLAQIIERAQARGIRVVLAGMEMPVNYGAGYRQRFERVFPQLAKRYHVALIPFLLAGVAARPALNQADGIHPNARGTRIVLDNVWKVLEPMLKRPG